MKRSPSDLLKVFQYKMGSHLELYIKNARIFQISLKYRQVCLLGLNSTLPAIDQKTLPFFFFFFFMSYIAEPENDVALCHYVTKFSSLEAEPAQHPGFSSMQ